MALRNVDTGRIVAIRLCVAALGEGRVVPAEYHGWEPFCPEHDDLNDPDRSTRPGACLENFHAESRMAAWSWRTAWRMWRMWRERAAHPLMTVSARQPSGGGSDA